MKRLKLRRWLFLLVLVPPALWGLVLALVPTEWARDRVEQALSEAAGQPARIDSLRLGPLGAVRLRGLELAAPGREHDPWLRVESVGVDIRLAQLLSGRMAPTDVRAEGLTLRIRRDAAGGLEFASLLSADPEAAAPEAAEVETHDIAGRRGVAFRLVDSRVSILDDPTGTRLEFTDLDGSGTWHQGQATLKTLTGRLNGGPFILEAELVREAGGPIFEGELQARDVALGQGMDILAHVAPILAGSSAGIDGRMDLNLYLRGHGETAEALSRTLVGQGAIRLDPIHLERSHLLADLAQVLTLPRDARLGSVRSDFGIANRRVMTKNLTLDVAGAPIVLVGWTDFDSRVDYRIRSEVLFERFTPEIRNLFSDLPLGLDDVLELRVQGVPGQLLVTLDGIPLGGDPSNPLSGREHIREIGRRLRDRVLR